VHLALQAAALLLQPVALGADFLQPPPTLLEVRGSLGLRLRYRKEKNCQRGERVSG
jgi:hypothetical protein